jgi:hypothetical protein
MFETQGACPIDVAFADKDYEEVPDAVDQLLLSYL